MSATSTEYSEQKTTLIEKLDQLIKQCQIRFVNRYELATECDSLVSDLCLCLENIFSHGFKKQQTVFSKSIILNGIISPKNGTYIWNFISQFLTEHEVKRFLSLRNVHSDFGRGRSWIRNSLNEHSLEKYILIIQEDKFNYRKQYYNEWALLFDDKLSILQVLVKSLNSILFALNIDNPDLDVNKTTIDVQSMNIQKELEKLAPVRRAENNVLIKTNQRKNNIIEINENMSDLNLDNDIYAKSAPVSSFFPSSSLSTPERINELQTLNANSTDNINSSSMYINDKMNLVLYPVYNEEKSELSDSVVSENDLNTIEILKIKVKNLESEKQKLIKENNLLNIQLKKYIAAIELIKYNNKKTVNKNELEERKTNDSYNHNHVKDYEKKLVQVSEMNGELVEFNEHLCKVIQLKDSIISRLRDELIELRGPLPENEEILSISSEAETNNHSIQSHSQPLIHIWIPTAFLSGGFKGKSHHIYQIYIRIKEEEWNVYRRYSQFYSVHKSLKEKHSCISQFEFPPKKAIGNKDSKVVQERRKKLESYLRNVINYIRTQNTDINNKEKLTSIIPFLSDKYFMQDRSRSETNLSATQQQTNYMGF